MRDEAISFSMQTQLFIRLRRRPRLRAVTVVDMEPFGEDRHFGVQARACPWGSIFSFEILRIEGEGEDH